MEETTRADEEEEEEEEKPTNAGGGGGRRKKGQQQKLDFFGRNGNKRGLVVASKVSVFLFRSDRRMDECMSFYFPSFVPFVFPSHTKTLFSVN